MKSFVEHAANDLERDKAKMSDPVQRLLKLKERVSSAQRDADRAHGALDQALARLRKEFGCKSLDDARTLLEEIQDEERALASKLAKSLEEFEAKWKKQLDDSNP